MPQRLRVTVSGVVQGVGFRPFVWGLATSSGLRGWVRNDTAGVVTEVEGAPAALEAFVAALSTDCPPLARVDGVVVEPLGCCGEDGFALLTSDLAGEHRALVPPDAASCAACLAEVDDPASRRYGYAFGSCTHCGPRYTIIRDIPYDRRRTTMADFPMCADCRREYDDPADRRFHAQPVCCPACGPVLSTSIADAAAVLRSGGVLAVKGLGGFHLAVLARDEEAVAALRARKHREDRPFAVMVRDVAAARLLCDVGPLEQQLLESVARPVVLLARHGEVAPSVAPGLRTLGLMLPYTPLHHLLLAEIDEPLVLTSGNRSDEPIAYRNDDAELRLAGLADAFLLHDREIQTRVDDSVVKVVRDRVVPIRRSRGYVPGVLRLPLVLRRPVLACGAQRKSTFALGRDDVAVVSHHLGDLDDWATYRSYEEGVAQLTRLFDLTPELLVHDLHPDYASTRYAVDRAESDGVELLGVQHHHAHIASCLVDNGTREPVIGVAFDGTGLGSDGSLWGGEVLRADLRTFERVGHLRPVPQPGGDRAAREPWRMAVAYLREAYGENPPDLPVLRHPHADSVRRLAASGLSPSTSSVGRLFDAVAAVLGVRDVATYEGQPAIELEELADPDAGRPYELPLDGTVVDGARLVRSVVEDLAAGAPVAGVAGRFHATLAVTVAELCDTVRDGLSTVALSGGVWQNSLLLRRTLDALEAKGFRVLTHQQVPCNDGGISLGQLAVAGANDA